MALVQITVVIGLHPHVQQAKSAYALEFGIVDGLVVIAVIFLVCSRLSGKGE